MQYGAVRGHAPANLAFAAVLTSSFALLAFSKYRRAQIVPITAPYCIIRFIFLTFAVLHFAELLQIPASSDCSHYRLYCIISFIF